MFMVLKLYKYIYKKTKFGFQNQIEQRKKFDEFRRQQQIELANIEIEHINQAEKSMADANAQVKRTKSIEILQFNDYMHRVCLDQEKIQMDRTDWTQVKRANDQLEVRAAMERQKQRQLLNAEQRVSKMMWIFKLVKRLKAKLGFIFCCLFAFSTERIFTKVERKKCRTNA